MTCKAVFLLLKGVFWMTSALTKSTYSIYTKSHTSLLLLLLSHTLCVPSCFLFRCPPHSRHGNVTGLRLEAVTHQTVNFRDKREKITLWVCVFFLIGICLTSNHVFNCYSHKQLTGLKLYIQSHICLHV